MKKQPPSSFHSHCASSAASNEESTPFVEIAPNGHPLYEIVNEFTTNPRHRRHQRRMRARERGRKFGIVALLLAASCTPARQTDEGPARRPPRLEARFSDESIACDRFGNLYLTSTERFRRQTQIFLARSNDSGKSWSPQFSYLNSSQAGDRGRPLICAGHQGEAYVLWEDTRNRSVELYFNRTLDGGATWLEQDLRIHSPAVTRSSVAAPALACDDRGNVVAVWLDDRDGFDAFYCNRSRNRGEDWLTRDVRITPVGIEQKSVPKLRADDNGGTYLAWLELHGGRHRILFSYSNDHGENWFFEPSIVTQATADVTFIQPPDFCVTSSGTVLVTWVQFRAGVAEVLVSRSTDHGRSWERPVSLVAGRDGLFEPGTPTIRSDQFDHVYLAWHSVSAERTGILVLKSSTNSGRTWNELLIEQGPMHSLPVRRRNQIQPRRFALGNDSNGNVFLAWVDDAFGRLRLGFHRASSYGTSSFGLPQYLEPTGHLPVHRAAPALCNDDDGRVHLLWNDGSQLVLATSPFFGDSGWSYEYF